MPLSISTAQVQQAFGSSVECVSIGDQEVMGLIPAGSGNILSMVVLSLPLIQEGQLPVSGKRMCTNTG